MTLPGFLPASRCSAASATDSSPLKSVASASGTIVSESVRVSLATPPARQWPCLGVPICHPRYRALAVIVATADSISNPSTPEPQASTIPTSSTPVPGGGTAKRCLTDPGQESPSVEIGHRVSRRHPRRASQEYRRAGSRPYPHPVTAGRSPHLAWRDSGLQPNRNRRVRPAPTSFRLRECARCGRPWAHDRSPGTVPDPATFQNAYRLHPGPGRRS